MYSFRIITANKATYSYHIPVLKQHANELMIKCQLDPTLITNIPNQIIVQ